MRKDLGALRALAPKYTIADYQEYEAPFLLTKHHEVWGKFCDQGESTLLFVIRMKYPPSFISPPATNLNKQEGSIIFCFQGH